MRKNSFHLGNIQGWAYTEINIHMSTTQICVDAEKVSKRASRRKENLKNRDHPKFIVYNSLSIKQSKSGTTSKILWIRKVQNLDEWKISKP